MRSRSLFFSALPWLAALVGCASAGPHGLAWTSPVEVEARSSKGESASFSGDQEIDAAAGSIVIVDAGPGDRVRVTGAEKASDLAVGIATRDADPARAITWLAATPIAGGVTFQVPAWSPSNSVVVRPLRAARLRVAIAEPVTELLAWERFEEDAVTWTRGERSAPPAAPSGAMEPGLRYVAAMRDALGDRSASDAGRAWLSLALVQEGMVTRPLTRLVFPWADVTVKGGREVPQSVSVLEAPDRGVVRRVSAGGDLDVAAKGADVVRLEITGGAQASRVILSAAGVPVRTLQIPSAARRSGSVRVRLLVPAGGALRARVEEGEATIRVEAYRHRPSLVEKVFLRRRDPAHLADEAQEDGVIGALASAARERDGASFRALLEAAKKAQEPGAEAVLYTSATSLAPDAKAAASSARAAFRAIASLRAPVAWPLYRRVVEALLERRSDVRAALPGGADLAVPDASDGADEDDRVAVRVGLALLDPKGPVRPEAAALATRFAMRDTSREDWAARARLAWQVEVGWRPLAMNGASAAQLTWATPQAELGAPNGMCEVFAGGSPRWTRIASGTRKIVADVPAGATHAVIPIRAEALRSSAPGTFRIDATTVPVHGAIGVASIVGVSAGAHDFSLAEGASPVLARVPREGLAPCDELRRMDRWALASGEVSVDVPAGPVETIARVTLRRAAGESAGPITIDVGGIVAEVARLGDDDVVVEAPIQVNSGPVAIKASAPVWMRVEVRARSERRSSLPIALPTTLDEAALLAEVRAASRALAASKDDAGRRAALRDRAAALAALGFRRLAMVDVGVGGALPPDDALDVEPGDDVLARALPAGSAKVVALNVPAQIAELSPPSDPAALTPILERMIAGDPASAAARFASVAEPAKPDEGTLLRALVTERARVFEPATQAYGRLALEADLPVAASRAALSYADLSLLKADPETALTGYLFAKRAQQGGADARAAMGRLDPAVSFTRPDTAGAAGHTWVERDGQDPRLVASLVERVRRAYLDAPEDATVLEGDDRVILRVAPKERTLLLIEHACALTDPAPRSATCSAVIRVDGQIVPCESQGAACAVPVPKGRRRVEIALESPVDRVGWARVRWGEIEPRDAKSAPTQPPTKSTPPSKSAPSQPSSKGAKGQIEADVTARLSPKSAARWLETDASRPLTLSFMGPTLVRVDARGTPGQTDRLDVRVDGATAATLDLNAAEDPAAGRRDLDGADLRSVRAPQMIEVIVMKPGVHALEIRSAGRALVSPSFAIARGLPRPSVTVVGPAAKPLIGDPIAPMPPPAPDVGEDAIPGPLSIAAEATLVLDRINDSSVAADDAGRYLETSLFARRRFLDGLVFGRLGILARARTGLPTFGADARVDFSAPINSPLPRVFAEGTLFGQQGAANFDVAAGMHAGVWWQFEPASGLAFVPTLGVDLSSAELAQVERYPNLARLDPDVYFRYDAPRPVEPFVTWLASYRATMDSIFRLRIGAHFAGIEGVDDVFAYPSLDYAPGRGMAPALTLGYALSYHFASASISEPYVRHRLDFTAFFWRWTRASHRVSASASAFVQVGSPFNDEPDLRLIFALGYDYTMGRGVSDYSPLEMQFRERFDEEGGRVQRRTPRAEEPPKEAPAAP